MNHESAGAEEAGLEARNIWCSKSCWISTALQQYLVRDKDTKDTPGQEARAWGGCAMGATQLAMPPRPTIPRQFALTSKSPWLHTSLSLLFQSCCVWRLIPGLGKLTRTQHSTENKKKSSAIWFHLWAKVAHTHVSEIKYPTLALMQY
jgi:hypothetical protein